MDSHLLRVVGWAEEAALDPARVQAAAIASAEGLPVSADRGGITPATPVQLVLEGNLNAADLEAHGARVNTQSGGITTVVAPLDALPSILDTPGLSYVSIAEAVHPMLDVSAPEVDADVAWQGVPPTYPGLAGTNVVVGIVDSGIDLTHADFKKSNNTTRIKYAWDQTWTGTKPPGFTYGAEWTEAQINSGAASALKDYDGHGTHVAGIAAGNGRATGNGQAQYKYVGIAPEADLVIVKTNFTDAGIIDGVNYVFQKAAALGKPAVVNLSIATQKGGHDGTYSLDTAISALTGAGKLVTAAVGNYGLLGVHDYISLGNGGTGTIPFNVPSYTLSTTTPEYVTIEGWHEPASTFQVKLTSPTGIQSAWFDPATSSGSITINDGTYTIENDVTSNAKGAKLIKISVFRNSSTSPHPAVGNWTITAKRKSTALEGVSHFWISTWFLDTTGTPMFTSPDPLYSIASPATADQVIATGAYATKKDWVNGNGGNSSYGNIPIGAIADFSSVGPRRDGVQRPDVVAPGYGVAASLSLNAPTSNSYKVLDKVHYMRLGTSAANAHTTGALAIKLEVTPTLTPTLARTAIQSLARHDANTGVTPNDGYGYGKLDVMNSSAAVGEPVAPGRFAIGFPFPNPSSRATTLPFSLSAAELGSTGTVVLRVFDAAGRQVAAVSAPAREGIQEVSWDGIQSDHHPAPAGVYFARLDAAESRSPVRKLTRLVR